VTIAWRIGERHLDQRAMKRDRRAELVGDIAGKAFPILERWRLGRHTARATAGAERGRDAGRGDD
jgi:hypothetical protein